MDISALVEQLASGGVADHLHPYPPEGVDGFTLVRMLKKGLGSSTSLAHEQALDRDVILKVRRTELGKDPSSKEARAFHAQAEVQVTVSDPLIATVHSVLQQHGFDIIVLEYVQGGRTLRDWQAQYREEERGLAYFEETARLVAKVCDALSVVHSRDVVHCDIKPDNILIAEGGTPKLADFGAARRPGEAEAVTVEFGTLAYMSPEHWVDGGAGLEPRSDIYSLGGVLHELLTFSAPAAGHSRSEVAERLRRPELPDPRSIAPSVPVDLAAICMQARSKELADRYGTAADMAEDLRRFIRHEPVLAAAPGFGRRFSLAVRRHPGLAAAALLTWVLLITSVWFVFRVQEEGDARLTAEKEKSAEYAARLEAERALTAEKVLGSAYEAGGKLSSLEAQAEALWPVSARMVGQYSQWLASAEQLRGELEGTISEAPTAEHPGYRSLAQELASAEGVARVEHDYGLDLSKADLPEWRRVFSDLVLRIDTTFDDQIGLAGPGIAPHKGSWGVGKRLASAQMLAREFGEEGRYTARWKECLDAVESHRAYSGIASILCAQEGLVPIGADPLSGLWEFWHALSGEEPVRGGDGKLIIGKETGLVFVLLPGGIFRMGAQRDDRLAPNYDPYAVASATSPIHEVQLTPFFMSKYEMTQQQWTRLSGTNPSRWHVGISHVGDAHPLENMSRHELEEILPRFGMDMPTEAQWEYGARGGTTSTWWPGNYREDLWGVASIADLTARENDANWETLDEWPTFEDGYALHAPVDAFEPNPFGLHGIHGNVEEQCRDAFMAHAYAGREGGVADPLVESSFSAMYSVRDGSWDDPPSAVTIARRRGEMPYERHSQVGIRPVVEFAED